MADNNPFTFNDDTDDDESLYNQSILNEYRTSTDNNNNNTIQGNHLTSNRLELPQNARISSSPKHQSVSHMRDNSQSFALDPFNGTFDDDHDNTDINSINNHHLNDDDLGIIETNSIFTNNNNSNTNTKSNININNKNNNEINVYENSNDSNLYNTSTTDFLKTPSKYNDLEYSNNLPTHFQYSPADSYNYYNNPLQQQLFQNNNYSHDNSLPIFQNFERDRDEPELDNNELFDTENINIEDNNLQNTNFADKCDNKVELIDGKYYSFDYPVPSQLLNKIPFNGAKQLTEFTHLRYHAITADPKDYSDDNPIMRDYIENYPLRQNIYPIKRETELMIVCTMYNEDEVLLGRTLKGIFKNIKTMYNLSENEIIHPFGKNTWKKIVVVIVSDGKNKINEKSKSLLTLLGTFQEGIMQESVNDEKVNAHLFEYTTTFGIGKFDYNRNHDSYTVPLVTEQTVPIQLMFLLKEENKQKINSHRWALNFLCPNLNPKVVVLLDVGTEPGPDSIYKLWKAFKNPKIGGACGEIRAMLGNHASPNDESSIWKKIGRFIYFKLSDFTTCLINPLIAAQNFEYKMSNILDKPMESAFGFVTVLPGAFSAYRYEALKGEPLRAYFHGEDMKSNNEKPAGILESNMYLAEDRILCFELVAKSEKSYLLKYVHNSYAVTDVPSQINEFINQRRRWLNGSFFAALYSILHFYRILISNHSFFRKFALVIEIIYQTINILLSWFALSIYFLVFRILTLDVVGTFVGKNVGNILSIVFLWIYIAAIILTFIISFGNKPNDAKYLYLLAFTLFAIIVIYMTFCVICLTIQSIDLIKKDIGSYTTFTVSIGIKYLENSKFRDLTISLASTYVLYIISSLIFLDVFHLFACTLQYILLSPAYVNVLGIFAFCNINDISWGTKGSLTVDVPKRNANNQDDNKEKTILLLSENLEDPDTLYKKAQLNLENNNDNEKEDPVKAEIAKIEANIKKSEKNYALGRTYTVIIWLICNFILLVVILRTGGLEDYSNYINNKNNSSTSNSVTNLIKRSYWNDMNVANYFMTTILWIVAGLALFRLCGCIYYRISFFISERRFNRSVVI
jgi:chitin synthase